VQTIDANIRTPQTLTIAVNAAAGGLTINGPLTATTINKSGAGGLTLNGTLEVAAAETFSATGGAATLNGDIHTASGSRSLALSGPITVNGSIDVARGASLSVTGLSAGKVSKIGAGLLALPSENGYAGATTIAAGAVRAVDGAGLPAVSTLRLRGGVLESSGVVARNVGSAAGQVNWSDATDAGDGGFAAQGGNLSVSLSGGATLTWGAAGFVPSGRALVLGSSSGDATVDWQNNIDLGDATREVRVLDNPASGGDVARISGAMGGSAGLDKTGAGTLELTGSDSCAGPTTVSGGAICGSGIPAATVLRLRGGAYEGNGTFARTAGAGAGNVNWSDAADAGSGGFSAQGGLSR
jgi:autotransporter-associated beta strand protein